MMSAVTLILEWVLQYINGGVLNALFKPNCVDNSHHCNYTFELNQQRLTSYFKAVILISGKDLPLDVLESFPDDLGGGATGVQEARKHPNRESVFMTGPLVASIFMIISLIGLILISLCTCFNKGGTRGRSGGKSKKLFPHSAEKSRSQTPDKTPGGAGNKPKLFDNGYDGYSFYHNSNEVGDGGFNSYGKFIAKSSVCYCSKLYVLLIFK